MNCFEIGLFDNVLDNFLYFSSAILSRKALGRHRRSSSPHTWLSTVVNYIYTVSTFMFLYGQSPLVYDFLGPLEGQSPPRTSRLNPLFRGPLSKFNY